MVSETILARLAARTKERFEIRKLNNLLGPTPGSIWLTKPDPQSGKIQGPMVLIIQAYEDVLMVVSVSKDTDYALEDDLILERDASELPFRCMVRTGDHFPTTREDLLTCVGELSDVWMQVIQKLYNRLTKSVEQVMGVPGVALTHPSNLETRMFYGSVSFGLPILVEDDVCIQRGQEAMHERRYLSRRAKYNFPW